MDRPTVLITGASRGIGLELATQLATEWTVFATCRDPSSASELSSLAARQQSVTVVPLDVTSDASVASAISTVSTSTGHLDYLINNAGQNPRDTFGTFDSKAFLDHLDINAVGALRVTHAALTLLRATSSARVAFVSSQLGSLSIQRPGFGSLGYNTGKAALNMIARKLSFELAGEGILTVAIHPGWVRTEMGGPNAEISPRESAAGILAVISSLSTETSGGFFRQDGSVHPW